LSLPINQDIIEENYIVKPVYTFLPGQRLKSLRDLSINSLYFVKDNVDDWVFTVYEPLQEENRRQGFIYNFRVLHKLDANGNIPFISFRRGELQPENIRAIYLKVSEAVY